MANRKPGRSRREMRSLRFQQIIFVIIGVMVILSMVLSMLIN